MVILVTDSRRPPLTTAPAAAPSRYTPVEWQASYGSAEVSAGLRDEAS